ncbi:MULTISPECIES: hypothetical protein [Pectobacterium]|uniref:hypothetical protein n=1 Tax=Pectobacterium TaxID=122277 RepID=UPI000D733EB3|nr:MULTISPECIES: hypothetical protein [Pectobacterium]PXB03207.1 hypothetical protein DMB41_05360 [Pectobacterium carotovorum subsp. carotovorum]
MAGMLLLQHDQIKQIIGTLNHIYAKSSPENGGYRDTKNRDEIDRKNPAQSEKTLAGHRVRKSRYQSDLVINQIW